MHPEGIIHHVGINYVLTPPPVIDNRHYLAFQQALMAQGVEFDGGKHKPEIGIERASPPLQIRVIAGAPPVGQLLVLQPQPTQDLDMITREMDAIASAFNQAWAEPRQILACDATLRYLHETDRDHAFRELWEQRLGQSGTTLKVLGRPVLGGGLRLVMPPQPGEPKPTQVEVKIESYLPDARKMFVSVEFKWPQPQPIGATFAPSEYIMQVEDYLEKHVKPFIQGGGE